MCYKKIIAFLMAFTLIVSNGMVVYADKKLDDVEVARVLGILKGEGNGLTQEYLGKRTTRLQAAIMFLRLKGLEEEALNYQGSYNFKDADKISWLRGKSILSYLKSHPDLGWQGDTHGEFHPYEVISSRAYTKVMLEALGYRQDVDFDWSEVFSFAKKIGLVKSANIDILTNEDIAVITIEALKTSNKKGSQLIEQLIEENIIDAELAEYCDLYNIVVVEGIDSAIALNSKVIEVKLSKPINRVDVDDFEVKESNQSLSLHSAEFAPWSEDNSIILLTLSSNLTSGSLYTLMSNNKSINFGGRGKDNNDPRVVRLTNIDFDEVRIEFSEPILIDTLEVDINQKNFDKENLRIEGVAYIDSHTIRITTDEQKKRALYGCSISNAQDLAGNTMDSKDLTFVGIEKSQKEQKVKRAKAIDYNMIYVEFETNIDVNSIGDATFNVERVHFDNEKIAVHDAQQATTSQVAEYDISLSEEERKEAVKKGIVLQVEGVMKRTLYEVEVDDLYTLYGQKMSGNSSDRRATFVGHVKPDGDFTVSSIQPTSATSVRVIFERKVEKDFAEDINNYEITYRSNGKTEELDILDADLLEGQKSVDLTVEEMSRVLYTLETKNIMDIYGNEQDTGSGAKKTFVGQKKQKAISKIKSIQRVSGSDTQIKVSFDAMVGDNAKDVSLYKINQAIGHPEIVETIKDDPYSVIMRIPETTETVSYKLTVKGLYNADGIAMDSDGVYGYFTGKGITKGLPVIEAVMTLDKHTIKVYFDRPVTDYTIKGVLWGKDGSDNAEPFLQIKPNKYTHTAYTILSGLKAYEDSTENNVLVVVDDNPSFGSGYGYTTYDVDIAPYYKNKRAALSSNESDLEVVAQDVEYTYPTVYTVDGEDDGTVQVFFSKPINDLPPHAISIKRTSDNKIFHVTRKPIPVSGSNNMNWLLPVDEVMDSVSYNMILQYNLISDRYLLSKKLSTDMDEQKHTNVEMKFAGNDAHKDYIDDIYALMTDDRTIEVHYPENMKYDKNVINNSSPSTSSNVDNVSSYLIRDLDGSSHVYGITPSIKYIEYKSEHNIAVLYLDQPFNSSVSTFGLVVNTNISNAIGTRTVSESSNDNGPKIIQVVNDDSEVNKGPGIESAIVSGDCMKLYVKMDSVIAFGDNSHDVDNDAVYESIDKFVNKTTNDTVTASSPKTKELAVTKDLLKALKIVTTFVGESQSIVDDHEVDKIMIGVDGRSLTFWFKKAIASGANGYITTKTDDNTPNTDLYNYNMAKRSKSYDESSIYFAAPNTGIFDYSAPIVISSDSQAYDSNQDGKIEKVEIVFNEVINQVGSISTALKSLTIGGVEQKDQVSSMSISGNKIVVMLRDTVITNTGVVHVAFGFSENNNVNTVMDNSHNRVTSDIAINIDSFAPRLTGIETTTINGTYAVPSVIDFKLIFNEPVNVIGLPTNAPLLRLSDGIGTISYVSGTGTNTLTFNYTIDSSHTSADLYVEEIVLNNSVIQDSANHPADLTFDVNTFKDSHAIVISNVVPKIDTITAVNGIYKEGDKIAFTMNFSSPVMVNGTPSIVLSNGIGDVHYKSGSGTQSLVFEYTVKKIDSGTDVNVESVNLNGATIKGTNNVDANITLPSTPFNSTHNISIDNGEATIESMNATDGSYGKDETVAIAVTFNKEVKVTGVPTLVLADSLGTVNYSSKLNATTLIFDYTPSMGHMTDDLDIQSIDTTNATITSNNGMNVNLAFTPELFKTTNDVKVDAKKPSINSITMPDGFYNAGDVIPIKVIFDEDIKVEGIPTLTLSDGIEPVNYTAGSNSNTLMFNYTVKDGDNSTQLLVTSIKGTIKDSKDNTINDVIPVITNNVIVDTIAPTGFDLDDVNVVHYSNAIRTVKSSGNFGATSDEKGKLQIAFAPTINEITTIYDSGISNNMKWNTDTILITIPMEQISGHKIFYRLIDEAGNPTAWIEDGTVVKPLGTLTVDQILNHQIIEDGFTFTNNESSPDTIKGDDILTNIRGRICFYNEDNTLIASQNLTSGSNSNLANFQTTLLQNYVSDKKVKVTFIDEKGNESNFSPLITLRIP